MDCNMSEHNVNITKSPMDRPWWGEASLGGRLNDCNNLREKFFWLSVDN